MANWLKQKRLKLKEWIEDGGVGQVVIWSIIVLGNFAVYVLQMLWHHFHK